LEDAELKVGGFTLKGWYVAAALPLLGSLSGGIYYGYDTLQRFYAVEGGIATVVKASGSFDSKAGALSSRIQTLEQAVSDNDVRGLNSKMSSISTQMQTILEQQKTLLELRSQVEKSTTITDSLGDKLDVYQQEIDDIWDAYDSLVDNPLK
jgi:hypothetical protein